MTFVRHALLSVFFLITIESSSTIPLRTNDDYSDHKTCEVNGDCPKGAFCYKEAGECAPCVNCSSRFRQNGTMGCHQDAADCGDCLPGYEEVRLERGLQKESCKPITPSATTIPSQLNRNGSTEAMNDVPWFLAVVTFLSMVLVTAFLISKFGRRRDVVQPQPPGTELQELVNHTCDPPPPPPYSPFAAVSSPANIPAATAPTLESPILQIDSPKDCGADICVQTQQRFWTTEQDRLVQAKGFWPPNWINNSRLSNGIGSTSPPTHVEESEDEFDGQHDENTQPSSWTPVAQDTEMNSTPSTEQIATNVQTPQNVIGSTAVGTVNEAPSRTTNEREMNCFRRRPSVDDTQSDATDQDDRCGDELQHKKRMRSESPNPPSEQQRPPSEFSLSQNNHNRTHFHLQQLQAPTISINFNLSRRDNVHSDSDDSPTASVPQSGELVFPQHPKSNC